MIYFVIDQILYQITIMKFILFISFISLLEIQEIFGTQVYTTDLPDSTTDLGETTTYELDPDFYKPQTPTVTSDCGSPQWAKGIIS